MHKNRQEPFWSVPAFVHIVLPGLVQSILFRDQTVGRQTTFFTTKDLMGDSYPEWNPIGVVG